MVLLPGPEEVLEDNGRSCRNRCRLFPDRLDHLPGGGDAMTQTALDFNRSNRPSPKDLGLTPETQLYRLYNRLLQGPVTNSEIVREMGIFNSTGRAADLRELLRPHLIRVEANRIVKSLWEYRLEG